MGASGDGSTDEVEIRALLERWARAVRAQDYPAILAGHAAELRMFDVPPPFESKGLEEYRRTWDLFFSTSEAPVVFDFDDMELTAGRDVAARVRERCIALPAVPANCPPMLNTDDRFALLSGEELEGWAAEATAVPEGSNFDDVQVPLHPLDSSASETSRRTAPC